MGVGLHLVIGGESLLFMLTESGGRGDSSNEKPYFRAMGSMDRDSEHKTPLNPFDLGYILSQ